MQKSEEIVDQVGRGWRIAGAAMAILIAFGTLIYGVGQKASEVHHGVLGNTAKIEALVPKVQANSMTLTSISTKTDLIWETVKEWKR